jgi:hypothetical protein
MVTTAYNIPMTVLTKDRSFECESDSRRSPMERPVSIVFFYFGRIVTVTYSSSFRREGPR